ncbi:phage gp6-like head-tail connector protein [Clostridium botulinum]|uniref:head-tail connector protein n=1 Tax=Clostridium botulinum TaxID=1491 RepID=UPI0006A71EE9|nr:head-tail connector protein [Clostridium botulinum]KAI3350144.1 head-tail connector protein [Clostridium botulinum]KOM88958.1 hypothetical protein ACP51_04290 [Clostridium botulinum]KOR63524.1 hypothetical protein ADT22_03075 [Clostridium botulinum]MCS6111540.1 phage gp6-like head-tail connector protein [Clostridium botulinum]NFE10960.1 phage gp6-like head-tail connector protein [Clostridium botulinum]
MRLSDLNLSYVKKFLNVDHAMDDARLQAHIDSAISYIALSHGYDVESDMEANQLLTDLALVMIQDLYDNGKITSQGTISFMTVDRRF